MFTEKSLLMSVTHVNVPNSLHFLSSFSMAEAGWTPFPLWDKRHPDGGKPVILMPKCKDLVISKRVDLLKVVSPNTEFWSSLEALHVVDTATRDRLKVSIKDRVGGSGRVLLLTYLNVNISLDIYDRNTYDIPKNSSFQHSFYDTMYYCMSQDLS